MDRRSFLRTSACAATSLAAGLGSRPATGEEGPGAVRRPNVVVIFADDLDFDEIGCFDPTAYPTYTGARMARDAMPAGPSWGVYPERPLTPHMDSLKRDGAMLDRFYMVCTVCTPSRYALLTGQHAGRSANIARLFPASEPACVEFNASIGLGQWTMPRAFRQAGYVTGAAGKWHTADWEAGQPGKVRPPICDAAGVEHGSQDPTDPENAARIRQAYEEGVQFIRETCDFDYAHGMQMGNAHELGLPSPMWIPEKGGCETNVEWSAAAAARFIEENKDRTFFLYFASGCPHGVFGDRFLEADPRATPEGMVDWHLESGCQPPRAGIRERLAAAGLGPEAAMPMWLDDGVGAVLRKLDEHGLRDNTIVVLTSDQQSRGKWTCYEGARVPAFVRWPRVIAPETVCDTPLASVDLLPTLLDACGIAAPGPDEALLDGRSFLPALQGRPMEERPVLIEMGYGRAVVSDGWKYIAVRPPAAVARELEGQDGYSYVGVRSNMLRDDEFPGFAEPDQLYNLREDLFEQRNLVGDRAYAEKLEEMKRKLADAVAKLPNAFGEFTAARGDA